MSSGSTCDQPVSLLCQVRDFLDVADRLDIAHLPEALGLHKRASVTGKWAARANNALRRRSYLNPGTNSTPGPYPYPYPYPRTGPRNLSLSLGAAHI